MSTKIGNWQVVALLTLSQLFWLLSWPRPMQNALRLAVAALLTALFVSIVLGILSRPKNAQILLDSGFARALLWGFSTLVFLQTALRFLTEFSLLTKGMFDSLWVLFSLLLASVALSFLGLEALCRSAFILFFFFIFAILLLAAGLWNQCNILNLTPPEQSGGSFWNSILAILPWQGELILYLLLRPRVAKPLAKLYRIWISIELILGTFLLVLCGVALGNYGARGGYPLFLLSQLAGFSAFSRMTPIYWFLLTVSTVFRLGIFFFVSGEALSKGKGEKIVAQNRWIQCGILLAAIIAAYYCRVDAVWIDAAIGIFAVGLCLIVSMTSAKGGPVHAKE